ncbi:homeodomain-interacting protein kinase 2-like [Adelges cooleyi]|uniref:homeodomain-interacting protein kinase 2-like n=1 Tax=Adelges cooleyi TaxID=133065 RepID=UPI00217F2C4E|nr:homeodomain-interacting protein kinase 2-like [Adelges cooleyi]
MTNVINHPRQIFQSNEVCTAKTVYNVQHLVGSGRFSRVFHAIDSTTGQAVVIKALVLKEQNSALDHYQFLKEVEIMKRLNRCSLRSRYARLIDTVQLQTGVNCLIIERLGTTLQAVLHNVGALPMSVCRTVVRQIAQGLVGLKSMGIVHADLKPDNIMFCASICNNYLVKIIDFGWAFQMKDAKKMLFKKLQALSYRAPEVCFCGQLDHALDIWALGCIMPEIVTGVKLFEVTDEEHLMRVITTVLPVPDYLSSDTPDRNFHAHQLSRGWQRFKCFSTGFAHVQNREDAEWFTDLVMKMLSAMPDQRITAAEALSHPFLTMRHFIKYPNSSVTKSNVEIMTKCSVDIG